MAREASRRKSRRREDSPLKEQLKIEEGIFDQRTMVWLGKMFTRNVVSKMDYIIGTGKEADIYLAEHGSKVSDEFVVLKVFRLETSSFSNRIEYMAGDPRFNGIRNSTTQIVNAWCKKEYGNLKVAEEAGVHAPRPYSFGGNVLAMEFIGEDGRSAGTLKDVGTDDAESTLKSILSDMRALYLNNLIHCDLSPYNILMKGDVPYIIDFGQAVVTNHPKAGEFIERDVSNILGYFSRNYGIDLDAPKELARITKKID